MIQGAFSGKLKADSQITFQVSSANAAHDSFTFPGGPDGFFYQIGNGYAAAADIFSQKGATLGIILGTDVVGKCPDVFRGIANFDRCGRYVVIVKGADRGAGGSDAGFQGCALCCSSFQFSFAGFQLGDFLIKCFQIGVGLVDKGTDLGKTCDNLFHGHVSDFHFLVLQCFKFDL